MTTFSIDMQLRLISTERGRSVFVVFVPRDISNPRLDELSVCLYVSVVGCCVASSCLLFAGMCVAVALLRTGCQDGVVSV